MTTYAFRDERGDLVAFAPELSPPVPVHAQRASAVAAVEAHRRIAAATRLERELEAIVTDVGRPKPYTGGIPANAKKILAEAEAAGFETKLLTFTDGCRVEGLHRERRVGFRATFTRGRASSASWHEPYRYTLVRDDRPVKVNALTRTGLKDYRAAGVGETHLSLLASPHGLRITHTELRERINP